LPLWLKRSSAPRRPSARLAKHALAVCACSLVAVADRYNNARLTINALLR